MVELNKPLGWDDSGEEAHPTDQWVSAVDAMEAVEPRPMLSEPRSRLCELQRSSDGEF